MPQTPPSPPSSNDHPPPPPRDAVTIKPLQVVVVGVVLAALFVLTLVLIVRVILSHAT